MYGIYVRTSKIDPTEPCRKIVKPQSDFLRRGRMTRKAAKVDPSHGRDFPRQLLSPPLPLRAPNCFLVRFSVRFRFRFGSVRFFLLFRRAGPSLEGHDGLGVRPREHGRRRKAAGGGDAVGKRSVSLLRFSYVPWRRLGARWCEVELVLMFWTRERGECGTKQLPHPRAHMHTEHPPSPNTRFSKRSNQSCGGTAVPSSFGPRVPIALEPLGSCDPLP